MCLFICAHLNYIKLLPYGHFIETGTQSPYMYIVYHKFKTWIWPPLTCMGVILKSIHKLNQIHAFLDWYYSILFSQEHGVSLRIEGQDRVFRGSIGPFSGDNLGAHSLGGFIESFSTLRICRFCMATKRDIQTLAWDFHVLSVCLSSVCLFVCLSVCLSVCLLFIRNNVIVPSFFSSQNNNSSWGQEPTTTDTVIWYRMIHLWLLLME